MPWSGQRMSSEIPSPFLHEWEEPEIFQKQLRSVVKWGTIQRVGDGAGRPCVLVLMQARVQEVGFASLELTQGMQSTHLFWTLTLKLHTSHHTFFVVFLLPWALRILHWPRTLHLSGFWVFFSFWIWNLSARELSSSTCVSRYACVHSPTHVCQHDSSVSQAEPS